MSTSPWRVLLVVLPLALIYSPATAQYMYIDANRNSVWTSADRLNADTTTVLVWLNTNHDRDGSTRVCNDHTGAASTTTTLDMFSFDVALQATNGGTVSWGTFTSPGFSQLGTEFTSPTAATYHRVLPFGTSLSGLQLLGYVKVTKVSGSPGLIPTDTPGLPDVLWPGQLTFGTNCDGSGFPNSYLHGIDWFDADGAGAAVGANATPSLSAPGTAGGAEGTALATITATATDADAGDMLTITQTGMPPDLTFTHAPSVSPATAAITGTPGFNDAGSFTITWTANDGAGGVSTATTALTITDTDRPPVVTTPASVSGSASSPISFTIAASDPDSEAVPALQVASLPPGATFVPGTGQGQGRFDWAPDPAQTGTFSVTFTASNSGGAGQAATNVTVTSPAGPRRPWVSPELRNIREGWSDRMLTRTADGRAYVNAFVRGDISTDALQSRGVEVGTRVGRMMTVRCLLDSLPALFDAPDVDAVMASGFCQLLLDSSTVDAHVAGLRSLSAPFTGKTGAGVVVGVVDTGIDFDHPDFRRVDGSTRILGYWDQVVGEKWDTLQINDSSPNMPWPQSKDKLGHGTHVAGIAAGNGEGGFLCPNFADIPDSERFVGVAPAADLCIVRVQTVGLTNSIFTNKVIDGVNYIFQTAASVNKPAVVDLSLGTHDGPHDGNSFFDEFIDSTIAQTRVPGRIVVAAAGNDAANGRHGSVGSKFVGDSTVVTIELPAYTPKNGVRDYLQLNGWFQEGDSFSVSIEPPRGLVSGPYSPRGYGGWEDTPDGLIDVCFGNCTMAGKNTLPRYEMLITLDDGYGHPPAAGLWKLHFTTLTMDSASRGDLYVREQDLGAASVAMAYWVDGADSSRTVQSPASADSVIAVAAYTTKRCWRYDGQHDWCDGSNGAALGDIASFSSRGPRLDGVLKPDISAPGAAIVSTKSDSARFDPRYVVFAPWGMHAVMSGTSQAAPHVTGAVALLLADSLWRNSYPSQIKAHLQSTARRDIFTGDKANYIWGYGKLDVAAALGPAFSLRILRPARGDSFVVAVRDSVIVAIGGFPADSVALEIVADDCKPAPLGWWKAGRVGNTSYQFYPAESLVTRTARLRGYAIRGGAVIAAVSDPFRIVSRTLVAVDPVGAPPLRFRLTQNAPNPFNPTTVIQLEVAHAGPVTLRVFSIDGRLVRTLVRSSLPPGKYSVTWDGRDDRGAGVASGVYLYEAASGEKRLVRKMTVLK